MISLDWILPIDLIGVTVRKHRTFPFHSNKFEINRKRLTCYCWSHIHSHSWMNFCSRIGRHFILCYTTACDSRLAKISFWYHNSFTLHRIFVQWKKESSCSRFVYISAFYFIIIKFVHTRQSFSVIKKRKFLVFLFVRRRKEKKESWKMRSKEKCRHWHLQSHAELHRQLLKTQNNNKTIVRFYDSNMILAKKYS